MNEWIVVVACEGLEEKKDHTWVLILLLIILQRRKAGGGGDSVEDQLQQLRTDVDKLMGEQSNIKVCCMVGRLSDECCCCSYSHPYITARLSSLSSSLCSSINNHHYD